MISGHFKINALILYGCLWLAFAGCAAIPEDHPAMGNWDETGVGHTIAGCDQYQPPDWDVAAGDGKSVLNADGFDLVNWNIYKGQRDGWQDDFGSLGINRDLFVIQEAYLTEELRNLLADAQLNWNLVPSFEYLGVESGVLTASRIAPSGYCMLRFREPLLNLWKSALITRYRFSDSEQTLLVANLHSINFTLGTDRFREHWHRVERALSAYDGPIILAGDLNTWSAERDAVVRETTRRLNLEPVKFSTRNRTTIFGHIVDHIYYRGLIPMETRVIEVATSDHNPMVVKFKLPNSN